MVSERAIVILYDLQKVLYYMLLQYIVNIRFPSVPMSIFDMRHSNFFIVLLRILKNNFVAQNQN